jgi:hypothetical protein
MFQGISQHFLGVPADPGKFVLPAVYLPEDGAEVINHLAKCRERITFVERRQYFPPVLRRRNSGHNVSLFYLACKTLERNIYQNSNVERVNS